MSNLQPTIIYTIGHSTRTLLDFIAILQQYNIKRVIDVRKIPYSEHNPQFNVENLKKILKKYGIFYTHITGLGGLRNPTKNSINTAWQNKSFRGYADYMQTEKFKKSLKKLINYACKKQSVIMCAESVPWRCHRSLIADALLVHHIKTIDIFSAKNVKEHTLTKWAHINGTNITYPDT